MTERPSVERLDERSRNQQANISDLYAKLAEVAKCIKRIEKQQWIVHGERAGMAIAIGALLAKVFGIGGF